MVFKFGIFTGGVERSRVESHKNLTPSKEISTESIFRFESQKVHPVVDMPVTLGSAPHVTFTTTAARSSAAASSKATGLIPASAGYNSIVKLQRIFLRGDGKFVWQKRGPDVGLYLASLGVGVAGLGVTVYQIIKMSFT